MQDSHSRNLEIYKSLLEATQEGLWDWNIQTGDIYYSQRWKAMLGLDKDEVASNLDGWKSLLHPDDLERALKKVDDYLAGIDNKYEITLRMRHKDGRYRHILCRGAVQKNEQGDNIRFLGSHTDVTDKEKILLDLKRAKEEAEASDIAKSDFLSNISHEIRTPMNGMMGMLQLLFSTNLDDSQKYYLKTVYNAAENLLTTLDEIINFAKLEAGQFKIIEQEFELKNLLKSVIDKMLPMADAKGLSLLFNYCNDSAKKIYSDYDKIHRVLEHVVGNAIKFTDRGFVMIAVEILLDEIVICVEDTGIGMEQKDISKLFQKFSQLDNSDTRQYSGIGMGLAFSNRIMEMLGGKIEVKSIAGKGSKFSIHLPIKKHKKIFNEMEISANLTSSPYENKLVLVAEDNLVNQLLMQEILKKMNFGSEIANNGKEAVEMYKKKRYDLVLMDCQMPVMDGFEATSKIREYEKKHNLRTAIIAITADIVKSTKDKCLEIGMDDFLNKPIRLNELQQAINKWVVAA